MEVTLSSCWAPWSDTLLSQSSACWVFLSPSVFPVVDRAPLPAGWDISTASDFLPLLAHQLQSITCCQTNLSTPFPSHNLSQDLTLPELPILPWPTLCLSSQPLPLFSGQSDTPWAWEPPLSCPRRLRGGGAAWGSGFVPLPAPVLPGGVGTKIPALAPAGCSGLAVYFLPGPLVDSVSMIVFTLFLSSSNLSKESANHTSWLLSALLSLVLAASHFSALNSIPCCPVPHCHRCVNLHFWAYR